MKTIDELIQSAERERVMRGVVYPKLVNQGKMSEPNAQHEIECMERIVIVLRKVKSAEPLCDCDIFHTCEKCRGNQ